ncbi:MAG: hypothetical protein IPN01_17845 [Deltaproteobacteria bacterium]|nr:hypothetical protein [Deltaproteobacteria bacterium]
MTSNSDGVTDIITVASGGQIVALDANGAKIWTSTERSTATTTCSPWPTRRRRQPRGALQPVRAQRQDGSLI